MPFFELLHSSDPVDDVSLEVQREQQSNATYRSDTSKQTGIYRVMDTRQPLRIPDIMREDSPHRGEYNYSVDLTAYAVYLHLVMHHYSHKYQY